MSAVLAGNLVDHFLVSPPISRKSAASLISAFSRDPVSPTGTHPASAQLADETADPAGRKSDTELDRGVGLPEAVKRQVCESDRDGRSRLRFGR